MLSIFWSCNKDGGIQVKPTSGTEESVSENVNVNEEGIEEESITIKKESKSEDISDDYVSELSYIEESSVESVDSKSDISESTEIESSNNKIENSANKIESNINASESSSSASLTEEEQSALAELQDYKNKKESNIENSEQSEKESEQSSQISTGDSTGGLEYKEINASDLPSETQEKTVFGIITGKEMLVQVIMILRPLLY